LEGSRTLDVGDEGYDADESDVEDSGPVSAWIREDYGGDVKGGKGRGGIRGEEAVRVEGTREESGTKWNEGQLISRENLALE